LPQNLSEDDIKSVLQKWGTVTRVRIPEDTVRKRKLGFAIVGFESESTVTRLLEEGEISVGVACLNIEKAMTTRRPDR
jgi:RNA recognition motif-containing protein